MLNDIVSFTLSNGYVSYVQMKITLTHICCCFFFSIFPSIINRANLPHHTPHISLFYLANVMKLVYISIVILPFQLVFTLWIMNSTF